MKTRMRRRKSWWSWGMQVVPSCGLGRLCVLRRPPPRPPLGGLLRSPRAAGSGRVVGPGRNSMVLGADVAGSGVRGRHRAAVYAEWVELGWAPAICEGMHVSVHGGKGSPGLHSGARGDRPRVTGLDVVGVCGPLAGVGVS